METQTKGYGFVSKTLHWLIFFLLAAQVAVGWLMPHIGRHTVDEGLVAWHFSIGAAILFFIVVRIVWRIAFPVPELPGIPVWQRHLARVMYLILYLLVLVICLLGWASTSARGWDVKLFGAVTLPPLAEKGARWGFEAGDIHSFLINVLLGFVALHVLAALYHHFIRKDDVLRRMLPFG